MIARLVGHTNSCYASTTHIECCGTHCLCCGSVPIVKKVKAVRQPCECMFSAVVKLAIETLFVWTARVTVTQSYATCIDHRDCW